MDELTTTLTSKGQLTLPVEVRRALGLKQGDQLVVVLEGQTVTLRPARSRLAAGYQSIPALDPPRSWEEVEAIMAEERAAEASDEYREQSGSSLS